MQPVSLRADCGRCAALCCISLAFDRSELFAFDKPAGCACPHLTPANRCGIHDSLEQRGFAGCARYDCLGAGQRVSQELFAGASWRDHPQLATAMFDAFRALRRVHELLSLLDTARALPLCATQEEERSALVQRLSPSAGWTPSALAAFERSDDGAVVAAFLRRLRDVPGVRAQLGRRRLPVIAALQACATE